MGIAGTKTGHPSTLLALWPSFPAAYTKHFWLLVVESTLLQRPLRFLSGDFTPHRPDSHQPHTHGFSAFPLLACTLSRLRLPAPCCSQTAQEGLNSGQWQLHTLNPDSQRRSPGLSFAFLSFVLGFSSAFPGAPVPALAYRAGLGGCGAPRCAPACAIGRRHQFFSTFLISHYSQAHAAPHSTQSSAVRPAGEPEAAMSPPDSAERAPAC